MTLVLYFIQDPDRHQHSNLAIIEWDNSENKSYSCKTKIPTAAPYGQREGNVSLCTPPNSAVF